MDAGSKSFERVLRLVDQGEGRCTYQELRKFVASSLPPHDVLADDATITYIRGRKLLVSDGWVTLAPKEG